jgi:MutS domain V
MKAYLMYRDQDFDRNGNQLPLAATLMQDLELNTLFAAMADGDPFLHEVAQKAVLTSLTEPEAIRYRQHILADCLERAAIVREMYALATAAIEQEKRVMSWTFRYPGGLLQRSVNVLRLFVGLLRKLRRLADAHGNNFRSEGFTTLFGMLARELDDEYLRIVEEHLRRLAFPDGVLMSAELDKGNKGTHYVLRALDAEPSWSERLGNWIKECLCRDRSGLIYWIDERDESGFRALGELRDRGISLVAIALAQSMDHLLSFFAMLRWELGFYVGCLNLRDRLARKHEPTCFPEPSSSGQARLFGRGLYDVCLSLSMKARVVGNEVSADDKLLVMITGANRGGKSTFLRSIGLAQLMMQSGMFVPAESFRANVCPGIFTHFKREEDASMKSGKLDEELSRMSTIIDHLTASSIVLSNESFASTNEREGSEIARQIVRALLEKGIKVFYVTHLFDLAQGFHLAKMDTALFLRAERLADGQRTFRLVEGEPLPTSYGHDLYRRIFAGVPQELASEI